MTRETFFDILNQNLKGVPQEERQRVNEYFSEYFDDGLDTGRSEQEICQQLGRPEAVAAQIRAESHIKNLNDNPSTLNWGKAAAVLVGAAIVSPIAFPFIIAAVGLIFALCITVFALLLAAVCFVGAMFLLGGTLIVAGLAKLLILPVGIGMLGAGLLILGLSTFALSLSALIIRFTVKAFSQALAWINTRFIRREKI